MSQSALGRLSSDHTEPVTNRRAFPVAQRCWEFPVFVPTEFGTNCNTTDAHLAISIKYAGDADKLARYQSFVKIIQLETKQQSLNAKSPDFNKIFSPFCNFFVTSWLHCIIASFLIFELGHVVEFICSTYVLRSAVSELCYA